MWHGNKQTFPEPQISHLPEEYFTCQTGSPYLAGGIILRIVSALGNDRTKGTCLILSCRLCPWMWSSTQLFVTHVQCDSVCLIRFSLVQKHTVEFNQVAMANSEGSEAMLNRVMTKDNIGVAVVLEVHKELFGASKYEHGYLSHRLTLSFT